MHKLKYKLYSKCSTLFCFNNALSVSSLFIFYSSEVFGVPIYLCLWHVRRCWLKHLIKKVHDASVRADMFRSLGHIMNMRGKHSTSAHAKEEEAINLVNVFMETYHQQSAFIAYFKEQWLPQIGISLSQVEDPNVLLNAIK